MCVCVCVSLEAGGWGDAGVGVNLWMCKALPESIEWIIEDQDFLRSYDSVFEGVRYQ